MAMCIACLCTASQASAVPAPLRIGVEDDYPPFAFYDEDGRHTGFDHNIAEALCHAMDRPCVFVIKPLDELLEEIAKSRIDILVAGLAVTPERKAFMDFSDSYFRSRSIYVARPGQISISKEGLAGKKIATQAHTIQAQYLQEHWGNVAEIVLDSFEGMLKKLEKGEVDVVLMDGLPGYEFLKTEAGSKFEMLDDPLPPDALMSQSHMAIVRGRDDIRQTVNAALTTIRLNGEYDAINRKYFPFSVH